MGVSPSAKVEVEMESPVPEMCTGIGQVIP